MHVSAFLLNSALRISFLHISLMDSNFPLFLQDCLFPEKLQRFCSSPPGCQWPDLSISRRFSPLFWGTSAWSACQHTSSTLHCFSSTWKEGEELKEWRRRLDKNVSFVKFDNTDGISAQLKPGSIWKATFLPLHCLHKEMCLETDARGSKRRI